ncbi:MAG: DnaJ domain-containing protein [Rhodothalassiaceae bacterium]
MTYLILLALVVFLGYALLQWIANAQPRAIAKVIIGVGLGLLLGLAGFLLVTGRLAAAIPLAASALGGLWRQRWLLQLVMRGLAERSGRAGPGGGSGQAGRAAGSNQVRTRMLRMVLDEASGRVSGEVLAGRFEGRPLDSLSLDDLQTLMAELQADDPDGARLLKPYLARRRSQGADQQGTGAGSTGGPMNRAEALEILGLPDDATESEIRDAHRRLIRKIHPDQGGSGYLAAKINQAKAALLGR